MIPSFKCGQLNGSSNLCFSGSICSINNEGDEACVGCDSGWMHSTVFFHFPNCSQPILFLPIFFAFHIVGTLLATVLIYSRFSKIRSEEIRKVSIWLCLQMISETLVVFAMFLEGGRFLAANILQIGNSIALTHFFSELFILTTTTAKSGTRSYEFEGSNSKRIKIIHFWRVTEICFLFILGPTVIAMIVLSHEDDFRYNFAASFLLLFSAILTAIFFTSVLLEVQNMIRILKKYPDSKQLQCILSLKSFLLQSQVIMAIMFSLPVGFYYGIGSYPFESFTLILTYTSFKSVFTFSNFLQTLYEIPIDKARDLKQRKKKYFSVYRPLRTAFFSVPYTVAVTGAGSFQGNEEQIHEQLEQKEDVTSEKLQSEWLRSMENGTTLHSSFAQ